LLGYAINVLHDLEVVNVMGSGNLHFCLVDVLARSTLADNPIQWCDNAAVRILGHEILLRKLYSS
jgi:hypothetical protein